MLSRWIDLCTVLSEAEQAVAEMDGELVGRMTIGSSPSIAIYVLPHWLGQFRREHPRVDISLAVVQTREAMEAMANNLYDFALLEGPGNAAGLAFEPLMDDELLLVVAPDHPWAGRDGGITMGDLSPVPLICHRQGSGAQTAIEREFQRHGREIIRSMVIENNEVTKRMVEEGLGVSILSRLVVQQELDRGTLVMVPVMDALFVRSFRIARRRRKYEAPPVRAFLAFLKEGIARRYPRPSSDLLDKDDVDQETVEIGG